METAPFVHPTAVVDAGARLGAGVRVWHFTHVSEGAVIGDGSSLGQNVFVAPGVVVGRNCRIQNNVSLYQGVELEDDVFCGPSAVFTNVTHPRAHVSRRDRFERTLVGRGASLGANCTVLCGTTLGAYSFVGAGAVVTGDVAPHALMVGVPARAVGWVCSCGEVLPAADADRRTACGDCGGRYRIGEGGLVRDAT